MKDDKLCRNWFNKGFNERGKISKIVHNNRDDFYGGFTVLYSKWLFYDPKNFFFELLLLAKINNLR